MAGGAGDDAAGADHPKKAIAGQLSWVKAADIAGVSARHMWRIRRAIERHGMSAVMDQRGGGRPRRKRISAGTIAMLVRLKRDIYPDFSTAPLLRTGHGQARGEGLLQLAAPDVAGGRGGGRARTMTWPVPAPAAGRDAGPSRRLDPSVDRGGCRNAGPGGERLP